FVGSALSGLALVLRAAGMELTVYVIPGMAERARSQREFASRIPESRFAAFKFPLRGNPDFRCAPIRKANQFPLRGN
ncbi:hypothetical protein ABZ935_40110, partial [Streptomyces coeruleorubidus]